MLSLFISVYWLHSFLFSSLHGRIVHDCKHLFTITQHSSVGSWSTDLRGFILDQLLVARIGWKL